MVGDGGYVLVYRRVLDDPDFATPAEALAFVYLILRAAWRDSTVRYKGRRIDLKRGQLAISLRDMAADLGWSKDKCVRWLRHLTRDKIATEVDTGVNIITVCNYDKYQFSNDAAATGDETEPRQDRDSSATQNNKGNKGKEEKKEEEPRKRVSDYVFSGKVIRLTAEDFDRWQENYADVDLRAALQSRDDWLATDADEKTRKRWFNSTSNHLANLQAKARAIARQPEWTSPC